VIDETREGHARVPEEFASVQWTRLPGGQTPPAFSNRVRQLLGVDAVQTPTRKIAVTGAIEPSVHSAGSIRRRGTSLVWRFALPLSALLLVLGGGIFWYLQGVSVAPSAKPQLATAEPVIPVASNDKSIAVLPFADMSAEKNQEFMADGIAEELLNLLAQAPDLRVIARTSSFAFKGQNVEVSEIAKRLNVAYVLEGSVRTSGDKMRITAQLVRTGDSTHLWSERFDRPMDDIFAVQDEIANAIVQALQIRLKGGTLDRRAGGTQNLDAYQLYLRAVSATFQHTNASLDAAEDYLNQAVKLDSEFGLAWYQLARVASEKQTSGYLTTQVGYERMQRFAQHALQLSPDIADAQVILHSISLYRDLDLLGARAELERAQAIDPTSARVLDASAAISWILGDYDLAERQYRAAMERDPLDSGISSFLALLLSSTGNLAEAESLMRSAIRRQPDREMIRFWLALILLEHGKVDQALAESELEPNEGARIAILPMILHAAGRKSEAEAALETQIKFLADEWAQSIAMSYAYMGDYDRALAWLERAYRQQDPVIWAVNIPLYRGLLDDPRYKAFLRDRLKLPDEAIQRLRPHLSLPG
jgi:TolB-like protein/Flp pilus assembly protein TadD